MGLVCFIEMSIGSGRDSIIESDVEEGDEVRDNNMHISIDSAINILRTMKIKHFYLLNTFLFQKHYTQFFGKEIKGVI